MTAAIRFILVVLRVALLGIFVGALFSVVGDLAGLSSTAINTAFGVPK